jgi:hypothetical protein
MGGGDPGGALFDGSSKMTCLGNNRRLSNGIVKRQSENDCTVWVSSSAVEKSDFNKKEISVVSKQPSPFLHVLFSEFLTSGSTLK